MTTFEILYLIHVFLVDIFFSTCFIVYHSHVWVRGGYMGGNQRLDLYEVERLWVHIIGEACFIVVVDMCLLDPIMVKHFGFKFPWESKVIFAGGIVGAPIFMYMKKFKLSSLVEQDDNAKH